MIRNHKNQDLVDLNRSAIRLGQQAIRSWPADADHFPADAAEHFPNSLVKLAKPLSELTKLQLSLNVLPARPQEVTCFYRDCLLTFRHLAALAVAGQFVRLQQLHMTWDEAGAVSNLTLRDIDDIIRSNNGILLTYAGPEKPALVSTIHPSAHKLWCAAVAVGGGLS